MSSSSIVSGLRMEGEELVVASEVSSLPAVCVKCGAPPEGKPIARMHYWHHPGWYLTILLGVIVYVLIAMGIRRNHRIVVHLCREHRRERLLRIVGGYLGGPIIASVLCIGSAAAKLAVGYMMIVAALLFIAGFIVAGRADRVLRVVRIDPAESRFKGASPSVVSARVESVVEVFE